MIQRFGSRFYYVPDFAVQVRYGTIFWNVRIFFANFAASFKEHMNDCLPISFSIISIERYQCKASWRTMR